MSAPVILRATQAVCEDVLWFQWPHALGHLAYLSGLSLIFLQLLFSPLLLSKLFRFRRWMIRALLFIGWEAKDQLSVLHISLGSAPEEEMASIRRLFELFVSNLHLDRSEERWMLGAFRNVSGYYCYHYT